MSEEWGPWIEHDGKGCPVKGQWTHCIFEGPIGVFDEGEGVAGSGGGWSWDWRWFMQVPPGCRVTAMRVVRYRIRKPRGLTILEEVANGVREPVDA